MRTIHHFMLITLALASVMTATHYAVLSVIAARCRELPCADRLALPPPPIATLTEIDGGYLMELPASDYSNAVLPDHEAAHADWIEKARKQAESIARERGKVSADDIWDRCPPPPGVDPRVMGAVFSDRKLWERVGYEKSRRKVNHGRPIPEWKIREAA